jgi:predicted transcriptional regulator
MVSSPIYEASMWKPSTHDVSAPDAPVVRDALDELIDYKQIAAESEAERRAGHLIRHDEVERQVESWIAELNSTRRKA